MILPRIKQFSYPEIKIRGTGVSGRPLVFKVKEEEKNVEPEPEPEEEKVSQPVREYYGDDDDYYDDDDFDDMTERKR